MDKHYERLLNRDGYISKDITSLKTAKVALRYVRRQPRCKGIKIRDIRVMKESSINGSALYRIYAKKHEFVFSRGKGYKIS